MNENLLIFVAGMVTAYVFMYFSMLLLRANKGGTSCSCGCNAGAAGVPCTPLTTQPVVPSSDDDALIAVAIAAASRR